MSSKAAHLEKYRHNKAFLSQGSFSDYLDWSITVRFYCSVHLVEALLSDVGINSSTHKERHQNLPRIENSHVFSTAYSDLYQLSRQARYECIKVDTDEAMDALNSLAQIEDFCRGYGMRI